MKTKVKQLSNYEYYVKVDTSPYKGQWIAIAGGEIVAHGKEADKVYKQAEKKSRGKEISLAKAPNEQMLVLKFFQ